LPPATSSQLLVKKVRSWPFREKVHSVGRFRLLHLSNGSGYDRSSAQHHTVDQILKVRAPCAMVGWSPSDNRERVSPTRASARPILPLRLGGSGARWNRRQLGRVTSLSGCSDSHQACHYAHSWCRGFGGQWIRA
jgi:hypothetical protein